MNLYAVLGIPRDADGDTIRNAYRDLARRYHPDRGAGSSSEMFRLVNEAYETLSDVERRRQHDLSLVTGERSAPSAPSLGPVVERIEALKQEDPDVFGRRERIRPEGTRPRHPLSWIDLMDRWFFDKEWP